MINDGHSKRRMLTAKQEKFVRELVKGKSQREAYKAAYNASNMKDTTIDKKASLLFNQGAIRGRYDELQRKVENKVTYDAAEVKNLIIDTMMSIVKADVMNDEVDGRAVKNKHWDRNGKVVYDHYDKVEAAKMLIGLLGIESASNDEGVHIHLHSSEEYDG